MTPKQKIELRQSDLRREVGAILEKTERSDAETEALRDKTVELRSLESDLQAAILIEGEPKEILTDTPEGREVRSILKETSIQDYLIEASEGHPVKGAASELRSAIFGKDQTGYIPIDLLLFDEDEELEKRVDAPTSVAASDAVVGSNQMMIYPRVFSRSVGNFLGVMMPSVGIGQALFPRISAGAPADVRSPNVDLDAVAATVSTEPIDPVRLTAGYLFTVESLALVRGFEMALRRDLRDTLMNKHDSLCINGQAAVANVSPKIDGLINTLTDPVDPTIVAAWEGFLKAFDSAVDGIYAINDKEVHLAVNPETWQYAMQLPLGTQGRAGLLRDYLKERFRASANMPDTVGNIAKSIRYAAGASSMARGAVSPTWRGLQVIRDEWSNSASGQVRLTFIMITGFKVADASTYGIVEFKLA